MSRKPEESPYICWIDLELDGNRETSHLLNIGAVMTDRDFNELSSMNITCYMDPAWVKDMEPVVVDMHTKNGLLKEALLSHTNRLEADRMMVEWIRQYTKSSHIPLGGSGVSHFDRQYIKRDLPEFNRYLSYWHYDVGVMRRFFMLFGLDISPMDTRDDKTHRAIDDIRAHIEEARRYKSWVISAWQNWSLTIAEFSTSPEKLSTPER